MRRTRLLALTGLIATIAAGVALAATRSPTLKVRKNVHVTNAQFSQFAAKPVDKHEAVAVGAAGFAVYTFQGETTHHIICKKTSNPNTNCWGFWPPVSVSSPTGLSKQTGIHGHLGTFHNHGMLQLTLSGQPVYYFKPDLMSGNKHLASGDELKTFGSTWHIVVAHVASVAGQNAPTQTTPAAGMPNGGGGGYGPGW